MNEVRGARCEVRGARCEVRGARCEVRGVRCEVREVRGAKLGHKADHTTKKTGALRQQVSPSY